MSRIAFEDIVTFDDHTILRMLKDVDGNVFAVALKVASDELLARVCKNISSRAAALLKEDIGLGPTIMNEVAAAQQQVVDLIEALEESGQIRLPRK